MNKKIKNVIFGLAMATILSIPTLAYADHSTSIHTKGGFDSHHHRSISLWSNTTTASGNSDWYDVIKGKVTAISHTHKIQIISSTTGKVLDSRSNSKSGCVATGSFSVNTRDTNVKSYYSKN